MFRRLIETWPTWAALPVRLALGAVFIAHGAQKVFGVWGGTGLAKFTGGTAPMGLRPAWLWLGAAAVCELLGGALVLTGLLTRLGALMILPVMLVAIFGVHNDAFFLPRGMEYAVSLLAMALALLISGGGRASVDERLLNRRGGRRR
ncbi:MAG: DoxX family protein [Pyrinomonadaceae bacterium]